MKSQRLLYNLLLLSCLLLGRCQCAREEVKPKPEPQPQQLPSETMEGKGTFGCLVNGEVWLPSPTFWGSITAVSSYPDQFAITGKRYTYPDGIQIMETITVGVLNGITGPGTYILDGDPGGGV